MLQEIRSINLLIKHLIPFIPHVCLHRLSRQSTNFEIHCCHANRGSTSAKKALSNIMKFPFSLFLHWCCVQHTCCVARRAGGKASSAQVPKNCRPVLGGNGTTKSHQWLRLCATETTSRPPIQHTNSTQGCIFVELGSGLGSAGLKVGLEDLRGPFQPQ